MAMRALVNRRRHRRPGGGAQPCRAGHRGRALRAGGRGARTRRRHQPAAARGQGAGRARPARAARRHRRAHPGADLLQPLRAADLGRAARARGGLRLAAVLDPSRPPAGPALPRRTGTARRRPDPSRASAGRLRAGRRRSHGTLRRRGRCDTAALARRSPDRGRRHPLGGQGPAPPAGRPAQVERPHALARCGHGRAVPQRRLDDHRRGSEDEGRALPDRP